MGCKCHLWAELQGCATTPAPTAEPQGSLRPWMQWARFVSDPKSFGERGYFPPPFPAQSHLLIHFLQYPWDAGVAICECHTLMSLQNGDWTDQLQVPTHSHTLSGHMALRTILVWVLWQQWCAHNHTAHLSEAVRGWQCRVHFSACH